MVRWLVYREQVRIVPERNSDLGALALSMTEYVPALMEVRLDA